MPTVKLTGTQSYAATRGTFKQRIFRGEQRECTDDEAAYLLDRFACWFEEVKPPVKTSVASAPVAPAADRAMKPPKRRILRKPRKAKK